MNGGRPRLIVTKVGSEFWIIDGSNLSADAALRRAMQTGPLGHYPSLKAAADAKAAMSADNFDGPVAA